MEISVMRHARVWVPVFSVVVALVGCGAAPGDPGGEGIEISTILSNAEFPIALAFAPDGRLFFTEKETGRIRIIDSAGALRETPFADVAVVFNGERGLLGVAIHPDFEQNGYVYAFYAHSSTGEDTRTSSAATDNRVVRFTADGNTGSDETLILQLPVEPGPNHNGGNLHFAPEGKLYVTIGELTDTTNSQDINELPGKILRINDDGSIPADNPFGAGSAVFALGLRNSFDFTFDPVSGVIFATENGTFLHDEVNRLPAGSNGGWPQVEGDSDGSPPAVANGTYVEPIVETTGSVVPTGIAFAPDDTFGEGFEGQLFVSQFVFGRIIRYTLNAARDAVVSEATFAELIPGGITDLAFAPDGSLYVSTTTSILRITPSASQ
jgi:glucose/arabinose dehydrogenase